MNYKCPKCEMPYMYEDNRARSFMCVNKECLTSIDFDKYRPIASALAGTPLLSDDRVSPSLRYRFERDVVNGILKILYDYENLEEENKNLRSLLSSP